jgi:hypothetical protein
MRARGNVSGGVLRLGSIDGGSFENVSSGEVRRLALLYRSMGLTGGIGPLGGFTTPYSLPLPA